MLTLLLIRHAIAEPRGEAWPDDAVRPLAKKGIQRMREVAGRLMEIGEVADVVYTSPLVRAVETARILEEEWTPTPEVATLDALAPGHEPGDTMRALARATRAGRIALVGHEPDLGELAAWLTGAHLPLPFRKGGAARIDVESLSHPRGGQLIWLVAPKMLRASE